MTCPTCNDTRQVERMATPWEVDHGCELGIAYDRCPDCAKLGPPAPRPPRPAPPGQLSLADLG